MLYKWSLLSAKVIFWQLCLYDSSFSYKYPSSDWISCVSSDHIVSMLALIMLQDIFDLSPRHFCRNDLSPQSVLIGLKLNLHTHLQGFSLKYFSLFWLKVFSLCKLVDQNYIWIMNVFCVLTNQKCTHKANMLRSFQFILSKDPYVTVMVILRRLMYLSSDQRWLLVIRLCAVEADHHRHYVHCQAE